MFFITSDKVYIINLTRFNKKCVEQVFLLALPLISNLVEFSFFQLVSCDNEWYPDNKGNDQVDNCKDNCPPVKTGCHEGIHNWWCYPWHSIDNWVNQVKGCCSVGNDYRNQWSDCKWNKEDCIQDNWQTEEDWFVDVEDTRCKSETSNNLVVFTFREEDDCNNKCNCTT